MCKYLSERLSCFICSFTVPRHQATYDRIRALLEDTVSTYTRTLLPTPARQAEPIVVDVGVQTENVPKSHVSVATHDCNENMNYDSDSSSHSSPHNYLTEDLLPKIPPHENVPMRLTLDFGAQPSSLLEENQQLKNTNATLTAENQLLREFILKSGLEIPLSPATGSGSTTPVRLVFCGTSIISINALSLAAAAFRSL